MGVETSLKTLFAILFKKKMNYRNSVLVSFCFPDRICTNITFILYERVIQSFAILIHSEMKLNYSLLLGDAALALFRTDLVRAVFLKPGPGRHNTAQCVYLLYLTPISGPGVSSNELNQVCLIRETTTCAGAQDQG